MSADQLKLGLYMKNMFSDLIYINSVIATELVKITENLAAIRHGEDFLEKSTCTTEHNELNQEILNILDKYNKTSTEVIRMERLKKHVLKHLGEKK
ncbi:MAG: hypothetical protein KGD70_03775 [Candidatus Lokiarchaeota archaeon]|jgi:hypothetical protein|nr:hypothetical protein [Candidatus Lokiarchaeota archaeon]